MQDGVYKVTFKTPLGEGAGVVVVDSTRIRGGDSAMTYQGTYQQDGNTITANVTVGRHTQGLDSVLGVDSAHLILNGTADNAVAKLTGTAREVPGISISVHLQRIGD